MTSSEVCRFNPRQASRKLGSRKDKRRESGSGSSVWADTLPPRRVVTTKQQREAVELFKRILAQCRMDKIVPRESVVRSRIEDFSSDDARSKSVIKLGFDSWLTLLSEAKACRISGSAPQRVIWSASEKPFECADYFVPQDRIPPEEMKKLLEFLDDKKTIAVLAKQELVNRGRFGFAQLLQETGPEYIKKLPHGYVVELVQLLSNLNVLRFKKGRFEVCSQTVKEYLKTYTDTSAALPKTLSIDVVRRLFAKIEQCASSVHRTLECFLHYERLGPNHSPTWHCLVTLSHVSLATDDVVYYRFPSSNFERKFESTDDAANTALTFFADSKEQQHQENKSKASTINASWSMIAQRTQTAQDVSNRDHVVEMDATIELDQLLGKASQAPAVYELEVSTTSRLQWTAVIQIKPRKQTCGSTVNEDCESDTLHPVESKGVGDCKRNAKIAASSQMLRKLLPLDLVRRYGTGSSTLLLKGQQRKDVTEAKAKTETDMKSMSLQTDSGATSAQIATATPPKSEQSMVNISSDSLPQDKDRQGTSTLSLDISPLLSTPQPKLESSFTDAHSVMTQVTASVRHHPPGMSRLPRVRSQPPPGFEHLRRCPPPRAPLQIPLNLSAPTSFSAPPLSSNHILPSAPEVSIVDKDLPDARPFADAASSVFAFPVEFSTSLARLNASNGSLTANAQYFPRARSHSECPGCTDLDSRQY